MPQEQGYQSQVEQRTAGLPMASPDDFGAGVGRGISELGGALHRRNLDAYRIERQLSADQEATDRAARFAELRLANDKAIGDLRTNAAPGAAGHAAAAAKLLAEQKAALTDGVLEDSTRNQLSRQFDSYAAETLSQEQNFETGTAIKKGVTDVQTAISTMRNRIRTGGTAVAPKEVGFLVETIHGLSAPNDVKSALERDVSAAADLGHVDNLIDSGNPKAALAMIESGHLNDTLSPEQLERARDEVGRAVRKQEIAAERVVIQQQAAQKEAEATALGDVGRGVEVDPRSLRGMAAQAEARGDASRAADLRAAAAGSEVNAVYGGGNATPAQMTAAIGAIERKDGWKSDPNLVAKRRRLEQLRTEAQNAKPNFAPIDVNDAAAVRQRMAEMNTFGAVHTGKRYFFNEDQATELSNLAKSGPVGRAQVGDLLSAIPGDGAMVAMWQVARGDDTMRAAVNAPPDLRRAIFRGEALRNTNPTVAKMPDIDARWGEHAARALRTLPPEYQAAVKAAAVNLYWGEAVDKGLDEFDQALWDRVVNRVISPGGGGGVGEHNGFPTVLPDGMSQRQLDQRWANLPDTMNTLNGDGSRIPRAALMSNYHLVPTVDDGVYMMASNRRPDEYVFGKNKTPYRFNIRNVSDAPRPKAKPQGVPTLTQGVKTMTFVDPAPRGAATRPAPAAKGRRAEVKDRFTFVDPETR